MEHVALGALTVAVVALVVWALALKRDNAALHRRLDAAAIAARAQTHLATVGELVSEMAHELKTPLQGVLGNTEAMLASHAGPEPEELRDAHVHAARAADIVRSLIAVTEAGALARRWQNLNDIADRAVHNARTQIVAAGNAIELAPAERLPVVYVDDRQLEKAISALLAHAGSIRAWHRPEKPITVSTRSGGDDRLFVEIEFPGVTEDAVERALAPGELDACRHVIEAHGGRVTVDSRPAGAGIAIELPATVVDLPPASAAAGPQESSTSWTTSSTSSTSTATGTSTS